MRFERRVAGELLRVPTVVLLAAMTDGRKLAGLATSASWPKLSSKRLTHPEWVPAAMAIKERLEILEVFGQGLTGRTYSSLLDACALRMKGTVMAESISQVDPDGHHLAGLGFLAPPLIW
jgi:hypothetical protein